MVKNELATLDSFQIAQIPEGIAQSLAEEFDGLGTISFDRVKIPSGGGLAFELPGEDEDNPVSSQEIVGIIVYDHPVNAYWRDKYAGGNEAPDCSSSDGKEGIERETGCINECSACPWNQFGSDGAGKACKNMRRLYIVQEGEVMPLLLTLPPTSLRYFKDYKWNKIFAKAKRIDRRTFDVVTRITLKKEKSGDGIVYSRAEFSLVGELNEVQKALVSNTGKMVMELAGRNKEISAADLASDNTGGFVDIAEGEGELPFA